MIDVVSFLPGKRKQTASGWISFNAPCCIHRGDTQDKRSRGGIKPSPDGSWSYHCFNCGYTASFVLGRNLTFKARRLLEWMNVPQEEIERINLESLKHKSIEGLLGERQEIVNKLQNIEFEDRDLPADTQPLNEQAEGYLRSRCIPLDYPFLYKTMPRPGVVIPFTHDNQVVGHTTRFLDDRTPRYIQDIQPGYVFGTDLQKSNWQTVIVVEGVFDAFFLDNSIPMLGKHLSSLLFETIYEKALGNIIICLDGDAFDNAKKLYRELNGGRLYGKIKIVELPKDKDVCDLRGDINEYYIKMR
jgi:hypothetical protein